ncbi:MAG: SDR family oxidoreductase [Caldilineae bacterium]|nr:SDR family oxidoreductase [Caldilineae bacterium]
MTTLVVGATGATGRRLVEQLFDRGQAVKAIVRSPDRLPEKLRNHDQLTVIRSSLLDLSDTEMAQHVSGCDAVASCLGHTMTPQGIWGSPRRLVTDATRRLCAAIKANQPTLPVKFVLMNTAGNRNRDLDEQLAFKERLAAGAMRLLVPPQADNEQAAEYLRTAIGQEDGAIEWVAVRPDNLLDQDAVSAYDVFPSPTQSAIFGSASTSRINVGHFMAELITDGETWSRWKGQMPVIYNREPS